MCCCACLERSSHHSLLLTVCACHAITIRHHPLLLRFVVDETSYKHLSLPEGLRLSSPFRQYHAASKRQRQYHQPFVYVDEFGLMRRHLVPLSNNVSQPHPHIQLKFAPTSLGRFRVMHQVETALALLEQSMVLEKVSRAAAANQG